MTEDAEDAFEGTEDEDNVEDTEEENIEEILEGEIGIEADKEALALETSDTDIASGRYTDEKGSDVSWVIDANGKLTVEGTGEFAKSGGADDDSRTPWYSYRESITSAEIKVTGMTDASCLFFGCLKLISVDLSGFNTSQVTNMSCMFSGCESLKSLDVSNFDTSQVTDMSGMFSSCERLRCQRMGLRMSGTIVMDKKLAVCPLAIVIVL